jgi:hypothetical protein
VEKKEINKLLQILDIIEDDYLILPRLADRFFIS